MFSFPNDNLFILPKKTKSHTTELIDHDEKYTGRGKCMKVNGINKSSQIKIRRNLYKSTRVCGVRKK